MLLIFLFQSAAPAFAKISPAIKLGAGRAELFGRDTYRQGWKNAWSGGMTGQAKLWKNFCLEAGLMYLTGGSVFRLEDEETGYRETVSLTYVQFPVLIKFYIRPQSHLSFYLTAGPAVAFNIKSRLTAFSAGAEYSVELGSHKKEDFSLNLAAGAEYKSSAAGIWLIELVFGQGLNSISRETQEDIRNRRIILLLGFRL